MKRMHTAEQYRAEHHERAMFAVKFQRAVKRLVKPARLYWNAFQLRNARDHADDMVSMCEVMPKYVRSAHLVVCQLEEQQMRIERDL